MPLAEKTAWGFFLSKRFHIFAPRWQIWYIENRKMTPTEQLKTEHEAIKRMLKILENIVERLAKDESVPKDDLNRIVEFIRVFADSCHHAKEENVLFRKLENEGMSKETGPIGVMLSEHQEGRGFVLGMENGLNKKDLFIQKARNYINLLSQHIEKEDMILYPMADRTLSAETQSQILKEFDQIETEKIGSGKHDEFHRLLDRLEKIYL